MVWQLRASDEVSDSARIDIRQAIISILQQSGRPLSKNEIHRKLVTLRGVNETFQISNSDPIIQLGPSLWGLNDRDIPIRRADQARFIEGLVSILEAHGAGIHASELERSNLSSSSGLSVRALFSLAVRDARLKVDTGQYLFLTEWGGPRRLSVAEALEQIVGDHESSLSLSGICGRVEKVVGRSVDRASVELCLRSLGGWDSDGGDIWEKGMSLEDENEADDQVGLDEVSADRRTSASLRLSGL